MHYYQFNIGDYASHTKSLSLMEDLAYRRLLDEYYLQERPLNSGIAAVARQIGMREYLDEVEFVLDTFFTLTESGWISRRADAEIAKYREMSAGGKRGAAKRWAKGDDAPPIAPPMPPPMLTKNQEPITNNHKPTIKPKATATPLPEWLDAELWADFKSHRIASKSKLTPKAEYMALSHLAQLKAQGNDPHEVIKQSIIRGWKGLFALNGHDHAKGKTRHEQLADKLADLTGQNRRNKPGPEGVIHGTAERLD